MKLCDQAGLTGYSGMVIVPYDQSLAKWITLNTRNGNE